MRSSQRARRKHSSTQFVCPSTCPFPPSACRFWRCCCGPSKYMELFDAPHEGGAGARPIEGCFGESLAFIDELVKVGGGGGRYGGRGRGALPRCASLPRVSGCITLNNSHDRLSRSRTHPAENCPSQPFLVPAAQRKRSHLSSISINTRTSNPPIPPPTFETRWADLDGVGGDGKRSKNGGAEAAPARGAGTVPSLPSHLHARGAQPAPRVPHRR